MLEFKGYQGVVEFDAEASLFHGEVADTRDVITFQGTSVQELEQAFRESGYQGPAVAVRGANVTMRDEYDFSQAERNPHAKRVKAWDYCGSGWGVKHLEVPKVWHFPTVFGLTSASRPTFPHQSEMVVAEVRDGTSAGLASSEGSVLAEWDSCLPEE